MDGDVIRRVDQAIDRLDEGLRAAGFDGLAPVADPEAVQEVDRALDPYSLPGDLRRFWQRVDVERLRVLGSSMPEPCDPRAALETHQLNLEPEFLGLFGPPLLFPIARHSEAQWSIELASRWSAGGVVVSHELEAVRIEYPSFTDLIEVYAELIEEGRFKRWDDGRGSLNLEDERERQAARLKAAELRALYGGRREIDDPAVWPAHWLESAGIERSDRAPLGATHTIAELVDAAPSGPFRARIAGEVVRLVGSSAGDLVIVDDGTGAIDVWCPAGVSLWGPRHRARFEFEVKVEHSVPPPIDVDTGHRNRPAAVAAAVRPLD